MADSEDLNNLDDVFQGFKDELSEEFGKRESIRVVVRDLDQEERKIGSYLQKVHLPKDIKHVDEIALKADKMFDGVKPLYQKLNQLISVNEYFKYHDNFRNVTQRLCYLSSFICYLKNGTLLTREKAAECLGVAVDAAQGVLYLELEDYLSGLLTLAMELARFSKNCVRCGEYGRPFAIATFVSDLDAGFRQLNLKNDFLRKKFDSLKYDVQKVEEIVYDLSIRGLKPKDLDLNKTESAAEGSKMGEESASQQQLWQQ